MAGTTPNGLPYPTGTDVVKDGDNAMQALATAVDTEIKGADAALAAGASVTLNTSRAHRRGRTGFLLLENMATTAIKAVGSTLCTLPAGYRPPVTWRGLVAIYSGSTPQPVVMLQINTDGTVVTAHTLASGTALYGSVALPLVVA